MIDRFKKTSQTFRLETDTKTLRKLISEDGDVNSEFWGMKEYMHKVLAKAHNDGTLHKAATEMLSFLRVTLNDRMMELRLMHNVVRASELNPEQRKFMFGSPDTYKALAAGHIKNPSELKSEYTNLKKRIKAMEFIVNSTRSAFNDETLKMAGSTLEWAKSKRERVREDYKETADMAAFDSAYTLLFNHIGVLEKIIRSSKHFKTGKTKTAQIQNANKLLNILNEQITHISDVAKALSPEDIPSDLAADMEMLRENIASLKAMIAEEERKTAEVKKWRID